MARERPIVDQLRELILSGEFAQGEDLLEVPTAARLGISRTPLRPAMAALEREGLLVLRGARGYAVRPVSIDDLMDAFLVRANLEGLAAGIVAARGLAADSRRQIEDLLTLGSQLLVDRGEDFPGRFRSMNERFHALVLEQSGNACLMELTAQALSRPLLSSRVVHFDDDVALRRSHEDHWDVLRAIVDHDSERARATMTEHILRSRDIVRRKLLVHSPAVAERRPARHLVARITRTCRVGGR